MIEEFVSIANKHGIYEDILEKIERKISKKDKPHLTQLQMKAWFEEDDFWWKEQKGKNLIIQGATSSGKTMVAEFLALQTLCQMDKKVVYLVPLRALVRQKTKDFRDEINGGKHKYKIYASSADYQDHDMELSEGDYNVAVVVYEKFFAMMADQKNSKFLENCRLIIVDEMQMLSQKDRGEKLEYALTKVHSSYKNHIRIVGLTTIDCNMDGVSKWLEATVISHGSRPIGLKEGIVSVDGKYRWRIVRGENNNISEGGIEQNEDGYHDEIFPVPGTEKVKKSEDKKKLLLYSLLRKIYNDNPEAKIIVFSNSRSRCRMLAKDIANYIAGSGNWPKKTISEDFLEEIAKTDDDTEIQNLEKKMLPFGVAYHTGELPMSLRECIEADFCNENSTVQILVATETLTIGMNMPADVMILFDNKVFRGKKGHVDIKPQDYKNYIGRAGRLGITDSNGESYCLVNMDSDVDAFWKKYVNCLPENVISALAEADEKITAPYYLNLLSNSNDDRFTETQLNEFSDMSLNKFNSSANHELNTGKIINNLTIAETIKDIFKDVSHIDEGNPFESIEDESLYRLTSFGKAVAPYALSLYSCWRIYNFFIKDKFENKGIIKGGLPYDYQGSDLIKNRKYILDIFYLICQMDEVDGGGFNQPRLPDPVSQINQAAIFRKVEKAICDFLTAYQKKHGEDAFWPHSSLAYIIDHQDVDRTSSDLTPVLRAILLYQWLQGKLWPQIRSDSYLSNTNFNFRMGDLERVAESCSYLLEAISRCFSASRREKQSDLRRAFYKLSSHVKYGMEDNNLIQIYNRNIPGISRKTIIQFGKTAKEMNYESPNYFLLQGSEEELSKFFNEYQLKELRRSMDERYSDHNIESLLDKVDNDYFDKSLSDDFLSLLRFVDIDEWLNKLRNVFNFVYLSATPHHDFEHCLVVKNSQGEKFILHMAGDYRDEIPSDIEPRVKEWHKREKCKWVVVLETHGRQKIIHQDHDDNVLYITTVQFCRIYLLIVAKSGKPDGNRLWQYLNHLQEENVKNNEESLIRDITQFMSEISHQNSHVQESIFSSNNNQMDNPLNAFCKTYNYDLENKIDESNAEVYRVSDKRVCKSYALKQIVVPARDGRLESLQAKIEELNKYLQHEGITDIEGEEEYLTNLILDEWGKKFTDYAEGIIKLMKLNKSFLDSTDKIAKALVYIATAYQQLNEISLAGKIRSNNIVTVYNYEIYFNGNLMKAYLIFSMELYDGNISSLKNLQEEDIIEIGKQISLALKLCHNKDILHRDIKPANIMYNNDDEQRLYILCDFGSANRIEDAHTRIGTPGYMAPEADKGEHRKASDIYSLGVTLRELAKKNDIKLSMDLERIIKKCEEVNISDRYETAEDLYKDLDAI